jgi:methylated-DNA-[protein]-cysteine S-methyltransferase
MKIIRVPQSLRFTDPIANSTEAQAQMSTPLGPLLLVAAAEGIRRLAFIPTVFAESAPLLAGSQTPALWQEQPKVNLQANHQAFAQQQAVGIRLRDEAALWPSSLHLESDTMQEPRSEQGLSAAQTHLQAAIEQLTAYFAGQRQHFALTLAPIGTAFQRQVWQMLAQIPYGHYCSYGFMAQHLNNPRAVRAVGAANGKNPLAIVLPCHRVVGRSGQLTGYAGGLTRKIWLLQHEHSHNHLASEESSD